ncbi:gram positive anchor [Streptococcus mitis SK1080]|uniref:Gram positive anchor n=1 Tax=Streptococcus mitis SK1080 TaxID=1008453 RepID=F9HQ64_STRMT|nr:gram positive anchor [Streptococcus mitis SK1080]
MTEGGPVVVKKGDNGTWAVEGNHPGVKVTGGSIEVPADKVGDSVTVTAKVGEGDLENSTNSAAYSKQAHTVRKTDIIKKPTDTLSGEDLHTKTGVVGVTVGTEEKDYASSNIHSVTSKEQLPSLTAGSTQDIPVTITYTDGSSEDTTVKLKVTKAAPTAPTVEQWQNGNLKVTPDTTNGGDRIEIPLTEGGPVVVKKGDNGTWTVEGNHPGVKVTGGSIEVPADKVGDSVTVTAKVGEGDLENSTNSAAYSKQAHTVRKTDIIKKPTDTLSGEDLHTKTGVVGVTVGTEEKDYASSNIHSVTSKEQLPSLTADSETEVPVLITYNDGSQENTAVTLKVAPVAPNVTVQPQDGTTGDLTLTIKRHDDTKYPDDSVVTVPGIDGTFKVKDGTIRIKNDQLKDKVQTGKVTVTEGTKLPAETDGDKTIPAKKVLSATPTFTVGTQNPQTGNVEVTVDGVPEGTKVKLPGIASEKVVTGGKVELSHNELPENPTTGKGIAQEDGKLPKEGTSDITIPGKLTSAKGEPAREFEVTIPLPIVVPDPEHLTPEEKTELEKKVKKSNPNMDVKVDDKGNVTVTEPKTGQSKVIPVKDLTVKDFTPVKPTDKVPVKDKSHLTPEEKKQVADKVKDKNPGKEVTVGDDGTATVTDPTTGISHTIPGTDLVNQDFEPVKPTEKVPVKDKSHLTPEEKKQVADKVKDKNPGKEVTVGDDGTATVTDPTTGISHTIPGTDLVNQDFEPVKPTEKVPVKDKAHLTPEEKKQVADKVKDKNPGKEVTVGDDGTATVTDPTTGISHTIPGTELVNQDFEPVKPTEKVPVKDKAHLTPEEKKQVADKVKAKNPGKEVTVGDDGTATVTDPTTGISHTIPGTELITIVPPIVEVPEYTEGIGTTGDGQQGPATPSDDTNRRPDTATPAEVPATQPTEQPSQTVEVPAQLPNEVSETDSSVSQPQAVLPNTGTQENRATGAFGLLSLLGAFGLLFAKKKKDDEEEA